MESGLNNLQLSIVNYLTQEGHYERHQLVNWITINRGEVFRVNQSEQATAIMMRDIIKANPTNACQAGIERFLARFPEIKDNQPFRKRIRIALDIEVECKPGDALEKVTMEDSTSDHGLVTSILARLQDAEILDTRATVKEPAKARRIITAQWVGYRINPSLGVKLP